VESYQGKTTSIKRDENSPREHAPWKLGVTTHFGDTGSSTDVAYMTQGELLTLWQQIGVLFNLEGMRNGLTDEEVEKMGVHRGK
jgi:hypothetical protein